nr:protein translocase subunit SecD [Arenimonas sp.]
MLQYASWKYVVAALVIALSVWYSLPNLYPQDPAVQVAANRGQLVDDTLTLEVRRLLKDADVSAKSVAVEGENLVVRTASAEVQTQAADVLRQGLGNRYTVALNLASTVPNWLLRTGARPMSLGLDLQG